MTDNPDNPWAPWGIIFCRRDGYPTLREADLWHLTGAFPSAVDRVSADEIYVHLDQPYRLVRVSAAFTFLVPAPDRRPPAPKPVAA